ncbi:MAG: ORF6N domain-containing protein [Pseudomonadota bacterium]
MKNWRCQFGASNSDKMGLRYSPMVFTEQGVAMLSSVLRSKRAIQVNIQIMRAFTQLRRMLSTHKSLKKKIESLERKYDQQFQVVFEAIKQLIDTDDKPKGKLVFRGGDRLTVSPLHQFSLSPVLRILHRKILTRQLFGGVGVVY